MKPHSPKLTQQQDLYRERLDSMISMQHELVRLSKLIDWDAIHEEFSAMFASTTGNPAVHPD